MDINKILSEKEDKINFLKGLIRLSKCDGINDDSEIVFYHHVANSLGLSIEDLVHINDAWEREYSSIEIVFTNSTAKMFFFIEAIQLCWMDGEYQAVEKQEVRLMAQALNISEAAIQRVELWVEEGMAWNKRGEELLDLQ